jgi:SAM-dependent methyltransferase
LTALDVLKEALALECAAHPSLRVLDAGCGFDSGWAGFPVPTEFHQAYVVGLDTSSSALAQNKLLDERLEGDVQSYPLPRNEFDIVVSWDVLEHLPRPYAALRNLVGAVRPGGILIIGLPNVFAMKSLVAKLTPHRFHVWAYSKVLRAPAEITEGGPCLTHLRFSLRPSRLRMLFISQGLMIEYFGLYGGGSQLIHSRWLRLAWRMSSYVLRILSLGTLGGDETEVVALVRKPALAESVPE